MLMIPGFLITGIFTLKFGIFRDIPGFIFCSNTYLSSLVNMNFSSVNGNLMLWFRTLVSELLFQNSRFRTAVLELLFWNCCFGTPVSELLFQNSCFRTPVSEHIFQNTYDKVWKLHLYVKPNMKIKEQFRQNVIKRGEKILTGYPRTHLKIPGFSYIQNPGIFYSGIFQASKSRDFLVPGFYDPGISRDIPGPGYPVDIPSPECVIGENCCGLVSCLNAIEVWLLSASHTQKKCDTIQNDKLIKTCLICCYIETWPWVMEVLKIWRGL